MASRLLRSCGNTKLSQNTRIGSTRARKTGNVKSSNLLPSKLLVWVLKKLQRQLLLPQQYGVGIIDLGTHLLSELVQLFLPDHACVAKPSPVGLDTGGGELLGLQVLRGGQEGESAWLPAPPREMKESI